jgi:hypothetical protein
LHLDFQNFMGGMPPNPPIQLTPWRVLAASTGLAWISKD